MKTLQKGSAIVTTILVVLLVVVLAIGAYVYIQKDRAVDQMSTAPVQQAMTETAGTPPATQPVQTAPALPPHATPDPVARVYTDKTFGFSVTYPKTYTASTDKAGKVTFAVANNTSLMPITIVKANNSADTSTGKWGKNVLSYSNTGWVTQLQSEKDGSLYTASTVPFAFTASGLPIFTGGTHHGFGLSVYVVALSHTKFLIISGGEGLTDAKGYDYSTDPTLNIAKTATVL